MRKYVRIVISWVLMTIFLSCAAQAKESYEYVDPSYYPQGLLAMFYGYSEDAYMDYVSNLDDSFGRVSNSCGEVKGYTIGRMASFYIDWNDLNMSDRQLVSIMLGEVWDVDEVSQEEINSILASLDSARVWLMGSETYGWGFQYDIPALGEEFYLFRMETSDQKKAFIIACRYEVDGGESVSFKLLEEK